jgi:hypothetical protein
MRNGLGALIAVCYGCVWLIGEREGQAHRPPARTARRGATRPLLRA